MAVFKDKLAGQRMANAEALADYYAEIADGLATRLAEALNRLRPYDPEYVARDLGEPYEPPTCDTASAVPQEIEEGE